MKIPAPMMPPTTTIVASKGPRAFVKLGARAEVWETPEGELLMRVECSTSAGSLVPGFLNGTWLGK